MNEFGWRCLKFVSDYLFAFWSPCFKLHPRVTCIAEIWQQNRHKIDGKETSMIYVPIVEDEQYWWRIDDLEDDKVTGATPMNNSKRRRYR
jgi:hypothetical protein